MKELRCSFCGAAIARPIKGEPALAVAGPDAFICRDCVGICIQVMASDTEWSKQQIAVLTRKRDEDSDPNH